MLNVLICNGRLTPKVNTVEEFVSEAKAYKNSIKTAVQRKNVGEANNEQEEEPAKADVEDAFESNGIQKHGEEYIELKMYNNEYYTHGSDSEGLFALTEVPTGKHREEEPCNEVHMQKVWLMAAKDAMDHPVLLAQDKEYLVMWVE
ncbi:hypothetical protein C0989_006514, partial [Termitomyces sp. Mn162]